MILDTTFLVDVLRGDESVEELVASLDERGVARASAVTVMELWEGIRLAEASDTERAAVESLLADLREIPFDRECGMVAGELSADLQRAGDPVDDPDLMIAATALVHEEVVVTRNVSDFERIDGVDVRRY